MTKLIIKDKFTTSFGLIVEVENQGIHHVGDKVEIDEKEYFIKEIRMPTKPDKSMSSFLVLI